MNAHINQQEKLTVIFESEEEKNNFLQTLMAAKCRYAEHLPTAQDDAFQILVEKINFIDELQAKIINEESSNPAAKRTEKIRSIVAKQNPLYANNQK